MDALVMWIREQIIWFASLDKADRLGVYAFLFCVLFLLIQTIILIVKGIRKITKPALDIAFNIEDVEYQSFRKKGFVTFDLFVRNNGHFPIEITRAGIVLSDGTEKTIYTEPHVVKQPDCSQLQPGEEAFFNDCDLFYCLNERPPFYKRITGLFVDVKDYRRYCKQADIPAYMNDQTVRAALTDKKGTNGF